MIKFALSTDSTSDLYFSELKEHGIYSAPLSFVLQSDNKMQDCLDNFTQMSEYTEFFAKLKQGVVAKTSVLNYSSHYDHFQKMVDNGEKEIVHITLSYGLSPTYDNAVKAAKDIESENSHVKIYCVESSSASIGQGSLVWTALKLRNEGKSAKETAEVLEKLKRKITIFFMVDDLNNLKRGGRVSGAKAMIGTVLNLKPILSFDKDGKLDVVGKVSGTKKAIKTIAQKAAEFKQNKTFKDVCVVYTALNEAEAMLLKQEVDAVLGSDAHVRIMGPIIGAHVGPGGVGYCFFSE